MKFLGLDDNIVQENPKFQDLGKGTKFSSQYVQENPKFHDLGKDSRFR